MDVVRRDSRPLYVQVQETIISRINDGSLVTGAKLPPEDQLAVNLGVSRTTLRMALGNLETMGFIRRIHGAGTFVNKRTVVVETDLDTLESFHPRLAARMGLSSDLINLSIEKVEANDEIATHLGVECGASVTRICRCIELNKVPVAYLCDYLPESVATAEEMQATFQDSVVDYFDGQEGKLLIERAHSDLSGVRANAELSEMLAVDLGETLLKLEEAFYTGNNQLISWSKNYIVPEYFIFHVERHVVHRKNTE